VGVLVFAMTIFGALLTLNLFDYKIYKGWHNILGVTFAVLGTLLCLGGFTLVFITSIARFEWKTSKLVATKKVHKVFGYFMIGAVQIVIITGIAARIEFNNTAEVCYIAGNILIWLFVVILGEIRHQRFLRKAFSFKPR
jgi:hypothetical protein